MRRPVLPLAVLLALAAPTAAQVQLGAAVGGNAPTLGMAELYHPGPALRLTAAVPVRGRLSARLDAGLSRNEGRRLVSPFQTTDWPDVRSLSVLGNALVRVGRGGGYALAGLGAHRQQTIDGHDPYGWVPGVQAGAGLAVPVGGVALTAEAQVQMVLSDETSNDNFVPSVQVPVTLGVRF